MAVNDLFLSILKSENEAAVIPFLRNLSKEDKATFTLYFKDVYKQHPGTRATATQDRIIVKASFVCLSARDFNDAGSFRGAKFEEIDEILEWYTPKWFDNYINKTVSELLSFMPGSYRWILTLSERGHIKPGRDLIVRLLPPSPIKIIAYNNHELQYDVLFEHPITISEHFWYLFEQESNFTNGWWIEIIIKLLDDGKIDRIRVLRSTLLAMTLIPNKYSVGWFGDLFEKLEPTDDELLILQSELVSVLNSKQSKAVAMSLNFSKRLIHKPEFALDNVLDSLPIVLSSDTKSLVTTAVSFCEKVLKSYPSKSNKIVVALCHAFIVADDAIQTRVSKLIVKYASKESPELKDALVTYSASIMVSAKKVLGELVGESQAAVLTYIESSSIPKSFEKIKLPSNFEELLFLGSQAFYANSVHDIDILPAALINLSDEIRGEKIGKLAPAYQRALQLNEQVFLGSAGLVDHLLSAFFLDYGLHLIAKFPNDVDALKTLWNNHKERAGVNIFHVKTWKAYGNNLIYQPHKKLLELAIDKIENGEKLPLVSTPTHEPSYLSQRVFVERLLEYQQANKPIDSDDLQIALARSGENSFEPADAELVNQIRDAELKALLEFHFFDKLSSRQKFTYKAEWMTAAAMKNEELLEKVRKEITTVPQNYFTGQFKWSIETQTTKIPRYNFETRNTDQLDHTFKELVMDFNKEEKTDEKGVFRGFLSRLLTTDKVPISLYECFVLKPQNFSTQIIDTERLLLLTPCHAEPILAQGVSQAFRYTNPQTQAKEFINGALRSLMRLNIRYRHTGHSFIALSMTTSDKTAQSFAAEIWIKNSLNGNLKSAELGEIIGKLISAAFVPLKRFTDLVSGNLLNLSVQHNIEILKMMNELIVGLPKDPPIGIKKLLEIYLELVSSNKALQSDKVNTQLKIWESSSSLKKVLSNLQANS